MHCEIQPLVSSFMNDDWLPFIMVHFLKIARVPARVSDKQCAILILVVLTNLGLVHFEEYQHSTSPVENVF